MKKLVTSVALVTIAMVSVSAHSAPDPSKMFGGAAPFTIENLPASRLKSQLENLPPTARDRAMAWLNRIEFPGHDLDFLHSDTEGGIFYLDSYLPEDISQADLEADPEAGGIDPVDAFNLHSKPGAGSVVYINFTGFTLEGTAWNNSVGSYQAQSFNKDSDPSSYSDAERRDIAEIWHRIAEDFAAFDIDVTTELPASFGPNVGHVLITRSTDANGVAMPHYTAGGVAYVGVWGASYYESYQPALVYYDNLASAPYYIAEAASHELGHNLGLSHDGTSTAGYYTGHGSGFTSWGPVMGVGYYTNVTQWSKGEYPDASNTQDDLAIISSKLQLRSDDHGDNELTATALLVDANGELASSNPEIDPLNQRPDNKGVIETNTDVDVFYFDTASGDISLNITPAWAAFTRTSKRGANLDIQAKLYDGYGTEIVIDPIDNTDATISTSLIAGRYYLEVTGIGNVVSPYSDYGSIGQYYISGTVAGVGNDITPPSPNPMYWAEVPTALNRSSISMTAANASDDSGVVEYQFLCVTGGAGCISSSWQSSASYLATGLTSNTSYSFQVKARDATGNETNLSDLANAITSSNTDPQSIDDFVEVNQNSATTIDVLVNDSDTDGDALQVSGTSAPDNGDVSIDNNKIVYTPAMLNLLVLILLFIRLQTALEGNRLVLFISMLLVRIVPRPHTLIVQKFCWEAVLKLMFLVMILIQRELI